MEQGRGSNSNMSSGGSNESIIYGITLQKRCACCSASNNNSNQKHTAHANSHHKIVHMLTVIGLLFFAFPHHDQKLLKHPHTQRRLYRFFCNLCPVLRGGPLSGATLFALFFYSVIGNAGVSLLSSSSCEITSVVSK